MNSPDGVGSVAEDVSGVAVTIDVDWAPAPALRDVVSMLNDFDVPATFFSTHADGLDLNEGHERALHPNFFAEDDDGDILDDMLDLFPDARGVRSHGLYTYTNLHEAYRNRGLAYESNYLLFNRFEVGPFSMHEGILQFPIHFMDSMWLRTGRPEIMDWEAAETVRVFVFHPIHVYLNSPSLEFYEEHKDSYDDPDALLTARHAGDGIRDTFREWLVEVERHGLRTDTLNAFEVDLRSV